MKRITDLLAIAPFAGLVIAVTYLQGYWGRFEVLAFPYLGFQELLAYSAAPLFGFILFGLGGMALAVLNHLGAQRQPRSRWKIILENVIVVSFCSVLIYLDVPEKWLFPPLVLFWFVAGRVLDIPAVSSARESSPNVVLSLLVSGFLLVGSFGYGRSQAERLVHTKEPNVALYLDAGTETGKLIGRLGTHYFFLNSANRVTVLPEQVLKRIEYTKEQKSGG